jgi:hypothetical protein
MTKVPKRAFLLLCGVAAVLSCRDPVPPPTALLGGGWGWVPGLLTCTPLAYDSVSETIGPAGGSIQVGPHVLVIPAGALTSPVTISAVAPSDTVNQVRFQPEGLQFQRPAALTMSYSNCALLGLWLPHRVAYTTDALQILEYLLSVDNLPSHTVTGYVEHFSTYAVAW